MSRLTVDLTTLPGWGDLEDGTYEITVAAKAQGYSREKQSLGVLVTKGSAPVGNEPYLTFSSTDGSFAVQFNPSRWDGTLEYSLDKINWIDASIENYTDVPSKLYLRGSNNTYVGHGSSLLTFDKGSNISIDGNIEVLLDWQTVQNGGHPAMATEAFRYCFANATALVKGPDLMSPYPANQAYQQMYIYCTNLTTSSKMGMVETSFRCCRNMYLGCTGLQTLAALWAEELQSDCYSNMYSGCTSIIVNDYMSDHNYAYMIPYKGNGSIASGSPLGDMFVNTSGNVTTPSININYYTPNEIVS